MRLLVVDAIDTMGRMGDSVMADAALGISEHLEELLLNVDEDRANDIVASGLAVACAILKPLHEQMLATTDGRYTRGRACVEMED